METVRPTDFHLLQEEPTPPGLKLLWARRSTATQLFEEDFFEELFPPAQNFDDVPLKSRTCSPVAHDFVDFEDTESDQDSLSKDEADTLPLMCLDASSLGDIPARYVIPSLPNHEFPVIGVYVDPRVVPGFKYKVRALPDPEAPHKTSYLFGGKSLTLLSIGKGYSRRLTFEPDQNTTLNNNDNYFWSDSRSEGFGFELQVIAAGDKFMIHDPSQLVAGTCEIICMQGPQEETSHKIFKDKTIEKRAKIKAMCKVEWLDDSGVTALLPISGSVVCVKKKGASRAAINRIINVTIGCNRHRKGFTLTPGVKTNWRRTTVNGSSNNDVPVKYTITGLESYELPVIGFYVDPRILPGFRYKVRLAASKKFLFNERPLRLHSIGMGYAKKMTFEPDSHNLNDSQNHFWSDSNPDGYGFQPIAVDAGMKFTIHAQDEKVGHAQIFRVDAPQHEIRQELEKSPTGLRIIKYIDINVTCHVTLLTEDTNEKVMKVTGTAIVIKDSKQNWAELERIQNIGLDSQINLLFIREHEELIFLPK